MSVLRIANLSLAASVALAIPVLPAIAQTTEQPTQLETLVIEDEGIRAAIDALSATGPIDGYVADVTATGSKSATPIIEIPQSVSVISRDQIEDRGVKTVDQALNYSAGVFAQPFGTDNRFVAPIIRGFEATNNVFLDSFRFGRDFGALAFEQYGLERVEILRGPASVLYGNAAPGGIVNLVTKRPTFEDFGEVGLSYGTNERLETTFDLGGVSENDLVSWRLTGLGRNAEAQQDTLTDDRLYLAPSITIAPDADTSLTILSRVQYDQAGSPFGLPQQGTLLDNPFGEVPIERYLGEPNFDDSESLFATFGYEFRHRFENDWEFRQNAQALALDFDYQNLYFSSLGADLRTVNRGASIQTEDYKQYSIDNQLEGNVQTGAFDHELLFGFDYRYISNRRTALFDFSVEPTDLFDPIYGQPITVAPDSFSDINATNSQTGAYVQDRISYGDAVLTLGLRHDWSDIDYRNASGEDQSDSAFSGRAGLTYLFDNGIAPYVSYATSFDPQIGVTTAGETYQPSEGEQYEVGVKFQPVGYDSFITVSAFDLTQTNVSGTVAQEVGGVLVPVTVQTGETNARGIELEAVASLAQGLSLIGSYSYTDAEIVQGVDTITGGVVTATTTGNVPAQAPEHLASLWLDYAFQGGALEGVSVGGGVRYVGSRFGNDANTIELPSTTVFDASIRYETESFEAQLAVNNIADERYVASCNFGCFYGEGRSVVGTLKFKW